MEERYLRGYTRDSGQPHAFQERSSSFFIAVPFIVCFSLFGVLNLVGGTALTVMSCRPKFSPKALASLQRLLRVSNIRLESHIDPMRVVGIMLLVTGSLLVVIGLALGVTACRSVTNDHKRRRNLMTSSMVPLCSLVDKRRASSSISSPSFVSGRGRNNGKKCLEKTVSPILEASGEYESMEYEKLAVEVHRETPTGNRQCKDVSPSWSRETRLVDTDVQTISLEIEGHRQSRVWSQSGSDCQEIEVLVREDFQTSSLTMEGHRQSRDWSPSGSDCPEIEVLVEDFQTSSMAMEGHRQSRDWPPRESDCQEIEVLVMEDFQTSSIVGQSGDGGTVCPVSLSVDRSEGETDRLLERETGSSETLEADEMYVENVNEVVTIH